MRSISSVKLFYTQTYGTKFDSEIAVRGKAIVALTAKFSCWTVEIEKNKPISLRYIPFYNYYLVSLITRF